MSPAVEDREVTEVSPPAVVEECPGSSESTEFILECVLGTARKLWGLMTAHLGVGDEIL